ncbi:GFA family protein [Caulobacter endophyticus]|uniref:Aldehyde-activating protein n=1 Tax=Caulobacter endophyticus TaxID=2172652 RepID=A0A2T9JHE0_9CAUL|nr:GFA family protein [Caulobacter endophyticus]PVM83089.1 aldehyde-activating protein [Caulobacter endophyticus]
MTQHTGGCQCGRVRFEVEADLSQIISCNCSRCAKLGSVLAFAPIEQFRLLSGEEALSEYRFNTGKIQHLFCGDCGIESFARGEAPSGAEMAAINVRCVDGVDVFALEPQQVDGKSF